MAIYLIRHGQTNGNRDRIVQTPETPLSDLGFVQAKQLALGFENISITKILCSDYTRTQQTAAPIHQSQGCELEIQPLLRERSFGDLRGKAYDDIDADLFNPHYAPPNGETHPEFVQRVQQAWQSIISTANNTSGNILIMTHGLVLRELVNTHLHIDKEVSSLSDFHNTCVTEIDGEDKKTVLKLCDISHLADEHSEGGAV